MMFMKEIALLPELMLVVVVIVQFFPIFIDKDKAPGGRNKTADCGIHPFKTQDCSAWLHWWLDQSVQ